MTKATKDLLMGLAGSVLAPVFVSIAIGVFVWYNNQVAMAEQNRSRDEKIVSLQASEIKTLQKLNQIAEDVAFIRGQLTK
jgi:hypothetical protein